MTGNNWKEKMTSLKVGQEFFDDSDHYDSLRAQRSKLKSEGLEFSFKISKGIITIKRTK
jgi:hypothetical protein